jgi:hypothetical protein
MNAIVRDREIRALIQSKAACGLNIIDTATAHPGYQSLGALAQ